MTDLDAALDNPELDDEERKDMEAKLEDLKEKMWKLENL